MARHLFTSESVTEGHPDKICDQISDAVLDAIYAQDPYARVACETTVTTGIVSVMGEITTNCYVDIPKIARSVIEDIGYTRAKYGFDSDTCAVVTSIDEQSADIALGVDNSLERKEGGADAALANGAGDQGMMFGYACDETPELMPLPISLAHKMAKRLTEVRKDGTLSYLRPDGKTQVTVDLDDKKSIPEVILISACHKEGLTIEQVRSYLMALLTKNNIQAKKYILNPSGLWTLGGPNTDSGLTGRKIVCDQYGGYCPVGGGAFSGKDPSKVDRSAAYMARYIAKHVVAAGLAERCEVQLAYAIGVPYPVSIMVDTFGTGQVEDFAIAQAVKEVFDCTPAGIIKTLDLKKPIYQTTAAYGHFGRSEFSWEKTDKVDQLKKAIK